MLGYILLFAVLSVARARTISCDTEKYLLHDQHLRERRGAYIIESRFADWKDVKYYITRGAGTDMDNVDNFSFRRCLGTTGEATMLNSIDTAIRYIERNTNVRFRQVDSLSDVTSGIIFGLYPNKNDIAGSTFAERSNSFPDACNAQCYTNFIGYYYTTQTRPIDYIKKFVHLGSCHNKIDSIIHEIGHKLGFYHMQVNYYRDNYLTVSGDENKYQTGWYDQWNDFPMYRYAGRCCPDQTNFDFCSNQMYPTLGGFTGLDDLEQPTYQWDRDAVQIKAAGYANIAECIDRNVDLYHRDFSRVCGTSTLVRDGYTDSSQCPPDAHRQGFRSGGGLSKGDIEKYVIMYPPTAGEPTFAPSDPQVILDTGDESASSSKSSDEDEGLLTVLLASAGGILVILGLLACYRSFQKEEDF